MNCNNEHTGKHLYRTYTETEPSWLPQKEKLSTLPSCVLRIRRVRLCMF